MSHVLVTGMSGAGKSTVLAELARRGHHVVDTDHGDWIVRHTGEPLWDESRITRLLSSARGTLFVAGTVANQGRFYPHFTAVVLLGAPLEVLLSRVAARLTNPYGNTAADRERITADHATVEPLLRNGCTAELDARRPVAELADELERLARPASRQPDDVRVAGP